MKNQACDLVFFFQFSLSWLLIQPASSVLSSHCKKTGASMERMHYFGGSTGRPEGVCCIVLSQTLVQFVLLKFRESLRFKRGFRVTGMPASNISKSITRLSFSTVRCQEEISKTFCWHSKNEITTKHRRRNIAGGVIIHTGKHRLPFQSMAIKHSVTAKCKRGSCRHIEKLLHASTVKNTRQAATSFRAPQAIASTAFPGEASCKLYFFGSFFVFCNLTIPFEIRWEAARRSPDVLEPWRVCERRSPLRHCFAQGFLRQDAD